MEEQIKNCRIILGDNMEYMKNIPDKCFDLAVVDPLMVQALTIIWVEERVIIKVVIKR